MEWAVALHDDFVPEYAALSDDVRAGLAALLILLKHSGPHLGRPGVDTLKGLRDANMKELRFDADDGVWRFAFAFDPKRRAISFCGVTSQAATRRNFIPD